MIGKYGCAFLPVVSTRASEPPASRRATSETGELGFEALQPASARTANNRPRRFIEAPGCGSVVRASTRISGRDGRRDLFKRRGEMAQERCAVRDPEALEGLRP